MTTFVICNAARRFATNILTTCEILSSGRSLAWRIERNSERRYPNGEIYFEFEAEPTGCPVIVIQQLWKIDSIVSVNDSLMVLLAAARLAKERGATYVIAVVPMLVYYRQDRPESIPKGPVATSFLAGLLSASGVDEVITWHLSEGGIIGWPSMPRLVPLDASDWVETVFHEHYATSSTVVLSPDRGAESLAKLVASKLSLPFIGATKTRVGPREVASDKILNLADKAPSHILIVDDLIVTGMTMCGLLENIRNVCPVAKIEIAVSHLAPTDNEAIDSVMSLVDRLRVKRIICSGSAFDDAPLKLRNVIEVSNEMLITAISRYLLAGYL